VISLEVSPFCLNSLQTVAKAHLAKNGLTATAGPASEPIRYTRSTFQDFVGRNELSIAAQLSGWVALLACPAVGAGTSFALLDEPAVAPENQAATKY